MKEEMEEEKKEVKKSGYALVEVPTQYGVAIQTPDGSLLSTEQGIVECLNLLRKIEKSVG